MENLGKATGGWLSIRPFVVCHDRVIGRTSNRIALSSIHTLRLSIGPYVKLMQPSIGGLGWERLRNETVDFQDRFWKGLARA